MAPIVQPFREFGAWLGHALSATILDADHQDQFHTGVDPCGDYGWTPLSRKRTLRPRHRSTSPKQLPGGVSVQLGETPSGGHWRSKMLYQKKQKILGVVMSIGRVIPNCGWQIVHQPKRADKGNVRVVPYFPPYHLGDVLLFIEFFFPLVLIGPLRYQAGGTSPAGLSYSRDGVRCPEGN